VEWSKKVLWCSQQTRTTHTHSLTHSFTPTPPPPPPHFSCLSPQGDLATEQRRQRVRAKKAIQASEAAAAEEASVRAQLLRRACGVVTNVQVAVVEAKGVAVADATTSDPYAVVELIHLETLKVLAVLPPSAGVAAAAVVSAALSSSSSSSSSSASSSSASSSAAWFGSGSKDTGKPQKPSLKTKTIPKTLNPVWGAAPQKMLNDDRDTGGNGGGGGVGLGGGSGGGSGGGGVSGGTNDITWTLLTPGDEEAAAAAALGRPPLDRPLRTDTTNNNNVNFLAVAADSSSALSSSRPPPPPPRHPFVIPDPTKLGLQVALLPFFPPPPQLCSFS
jgi:hypothetical protein